MNKNNMGGRIREEVNRIGRPSIELIQQEAGRLERIEGYRQLARTIAISLVVAAALIVIATNLWVAVLKVNGSSMAPLLQTDEIVFAVRTDKPERNDIIAFYHNGKLYIKRVIAAAGDKVNIGADGVVSVNGEKRKEPYIAEPSLGSCDIDLPFMVPSGTVFVMGDNRPASMDSRDSRFGPVRGEQIVGRVALRLWPLPRIGTIQ